MENIELRVLDSPQELQQVEKLQALVWGGEDVVPSHMMLASINAGGLVIGAFRKSELLGFAFGFVGFHEYEKKTGVKHCSHMLGVHPEFQGSGIGEMLKKAQWKVIRKQGLDLITWTFDPLQSRNAKLNISKLGGISKTYYRDYYGEMHDRLNEGIASDRLLVEWWLNSRRVLTRLSDSPKPLNLKHYLSGNIPIINSVKWPQEGMPVPDEDSMDLLERTENKPKIFLFQIPSNFAELKQSNRELAITWRQYSRIIFELSFSHGYLISDFIYEKEDPRIGYYVFSDGNSLIGL